MGVTTDCGFDDGWDEFWDSNETPEPPDKCPLCGGELVEKKGKFGEFYGCKNFPKCTFTFSK